MIHPLFQGWYGYYGSESERLCDLIYQMCERAVLDAAFDRLSLPSFMRWKVWSVITGTVRQGIVSLCTPAISGAFEAAKPIMTAVKETCQAGLDPIFSAQNQLEAQVQSSMHTHQ